MKKVEFEELLMEDNITGASKNKIIEEYFKNDGIKGNNESKSIFNPLNEIFYNYVIVALIIIFIMLTSIKQIEFQSTIVSFFLVVYLIFRSIEYKVNCND